MDVKKINPFYWVIIILAIIAILVGGIMVKTFTANSTAPTSVETPVKPWAEMTCVERFRQIRKQNNQGSVDYYVNATGCSEGQVASMLATGN